MSHSTQSFSILTLLSGRQKKNQGFSTTVNEVTNAKNKGQMKTTYEMKIRGWGGLKYNWNKKQTGNGQKWSGIEEGCSGSQGA
jgi:hypothetical protein